MLHLTVFITSAVIMAYELAGARLLAPYLGTSVEVWAGLIAMILAGMSLGYWWGGRLADRFPEQRWLAGIVFFAALAILLSWGLRESIPFFFGQLRGFSLTWLSLLASLCLFVPATLLLGMVSPFVAKLSLRDLAHSAGTLGSLYAIGAIGSLVGTVVTSAWLIQYVGTGMLLLMLAGTLFLLSFLLQFRWEPVARAGIFLAVLGLSGVLSLAGAGAEPGKIAQVDTPYNRITLSEGGPAGARLRMLQTDPFAVQCAASIDRTGQAGTKLAFPYLEFYDIAFELVPEAEELLMLGGCNYSYPRHALRERPAARMDVVELDPGMTQVARDYFSLQDDPRLTIIHEDARTFLNRSAGSYDAIFVDVFNSHLTIPFQVATEEAALRLRENLSPEGVVIINFLGSAEGPAGELFRAQYATLGAVFPHLSAFQLDKRSLQDPQNIMVIASKRDLGAALASVGSEKLRYPLPDKALSAGPVLTDDYAPMDRLARPLQELFAEYR